MSNEPVKRASYRQIKVKLVALLCCNEWFILLEWFWVHLAPLWEVPQDISTKLFMMKYFYADESTLFHDDIIPTHSHIAVCIHSMYTGYVICDLLSPGDDKLRLSYSNGMESLE